VTAALRKLIRHAEVHGVEFVFESGMGELADDELEALARRLARLDPKWRFPENWANGRNGAASPLSRAEKRNAKGNPNSRARRAVCAECGVTFPAARSTARYCSTACRVRAHRRVS
jgi:hypothetical protein